MKHARLAKAIVSALLLAFAAVVLRRNQGGRAPHPPPTSRPAPAQHPAPVEVDTDVRGHRTLRHLGSALAVIVPLLLVSALAWWALEDAWRLLPAFLSGVLLVALGFWKIPQWQAEDAHRRDAKKSIFELENEARKTLGEAVSGLFLVIGLAFTWQQLASDREAQHDVEIRAATEQALTREGQITERFTAAVNQLGDDQLRVRLGGIYALERIAHDSRDDAGPVVEILTAFVRERVPWPPPDTATPTPMDESTPDASTPVMRRRIPAADVQAVLTVIGRGDWDVWWPGHNEDAPGPGGLLCLNLNGTDLRGARLRDKNLPPICMDGANLSGANLTGADLTGVYLTNADLTGAFLTGADLTDAYMPNANLENANLRNVNLMDAYLVDAKLQGADLTGALNVTQGQIDSAEIDAETRLPLGLRLPPATPRPQHARWLTTSPNPAADRHTSPMIAIRDMVPWESITYETGYQFTDLVHDLC